LVFPRRQVLEREIERSFRDVTLGEIIPVEATVSVNILRKFSRLF